MLTVSKVKAHLTKLNSLMLWRSITPETPDKEIFTALQELLKRINSGTENTADILTPSGIKTLMNLLETEHDTQVHTLAVAVIAVLNSDPKIQEFMMKKNILNPLARLLDKDTDGIDANSTKALLLVQMYEHLLNLFLLFTYGHRSTREACFCENVIMKVTNFLSHKSKAKSILYGYNAQSITETMQLVYRKKLSAKVKFIDNSKDFDSVLHKYIDSDIESKLKVRKLYCEVELYDRSLDGDINISKKLVNKNLAWSDNSNNTDCEEVWKDVFVAGIVSQEFFFLHLGQESIQAVSEVQNRIASHPENQRNYLKRPPLLGMFVCALNSDCGYYRGQVLRSEEYLCDVYALDHGFMEQIHCEQLFLMTREMDIVSIPPQATLCKLRGISGKFLHHKIAESGLAILVNMSSSNSSESHFSQAAILDDLHVMATSPERTMICKVFRIFCNISRYESIKKRLIKLQIIQTILDCCQRYAKNLSEISNQIVLESAAALLTNMLYRSDNNKAQFVELNGLEILLPLVADTVPARVRQAVLKAMKVFVSTENMDMSSSNGGLPFSRNYNEREAYSIVVDNVMRGRKKTRPESVPVEKSLFRVGDQKKESPVIPKISGSLYSKESRLARDEHIASKPRTRTRSRSQGRPPPDDEIEKRVVARLDQRTSRHQFSSDVSDEEDDNEASPGISGMKSTGRTALDEEDSSGTDGEKIISAANSSQKAVKVVHATAHYNRQKDHSYYVQGTRVPFEHDEMHEIREINCINRIKVPAIAQITCGFLNGKKGGSIYFGIQKGGTVLGIPADRDQRDEFRIGIDRVFTNSLRPPLMLSQYDIVYTPVASFDGYKNTETRKMISNRYVLEIKIKAYNSSVLYSTSEDEAYFREGSQTLQASAQDRHVNIIEDKEEKYLLEMEVLKQQISHLKLRKQSAQS